MDLKEININILNIKNIIIFFILITSNCLFAMLDYCPKLKHPVTVTTIPKSGTHLLDKCIKMLLDYDLESRSNLVLEDFKTLPSSVSNHLYWVKHFHPTTNECNDQSHLGSNPKIIINVRDFRDVVMSSSFVKTQEKWETMSENQKIIQLIQDTDNLSLQNQISQLIEMLENCPSALLVRFENLIGPNGGGNLEIQKNEIQKIADYLEIPLSKKKLNHIVKNLYGKSATFNKGKMNSWKNAFDKNHKEEFKKIFGEYLIYFGYEKNNNW